MAVTLHADCAGVRIGDGGRGLCLHNVNELYTPAALINEITIGNASTTKFTSITTSTTLAGATNNQVPTALAVKTYADTSNIATIPRVWAADFSTTAPNAPIIATRTSGGDVNIYIPPMTLAEDLAFAGAIHSDGQLLPAIYRPTGQTIISAASIAQIDNGAGVAVNEPVVAEVTPAGRLRIYRQVLGVIQPFPAGVLAIPVVTPPMIIHYNVNM